MIRRINFGLKCRIAVRRQIAPWEITSIEVLDLILTLHPAQDVC